MNGQVRFWKDKDYRDSLTDEEAAQFSENPAGAIELTDEELLDVTGGRGGSSNRGRRVRWGTPPKTPKTPNPPSSSTPPRQWREYKPTPSYKRRYGR